MDVQIAATEIEIGYNVDIHPTVKFLGDFRSVKIGDNTVIGEGVVILGDRGGLFSVGDYSKFHRNSFINARGTVQLGHCTWVGERSTLDGTGLLQSGDFLGVGIGSCLYSHIQHGDVVEGCLYDSKSELIIGNDVWFVGECFVNPIVALDKSMAMLGSVVTKNMSRNHVYGGNPAVDITDRMIPGWVERSPKEKQDRLNVLLDTAWNNKIIEDLDQFEAVLEFPEVFESGKTYYNTTTREYTKTNSIQEIKLNNWLFASKAKFRPRDNNDSTI